MSRVDRKGRRSKRRGTLETQKSDRSEIMGGLQKKVLRFSQRHKKHFKGEGKKGGNAPCMGGRAKGGGLGSTRTRSWEKSY